MVIVSFGMLYRHARKQVEQRLHKFSPGASITYRGFRPSRTHGFYFSFDVHGDEYRSAHWRLIPEGHIDFSK